MVLGILELFSRDAADAMPFFLPVGLIGVVRLSLFLIRLVCYLLYRPRRPSSVTPSRYKSSDVTVIVPTIDAGPEFIRAASQWIKNRPAEIIVVTTHALRNDIESFVASLPDAGHFRVLSVPYANKRVQLVEGINAATTPILALSDDDAIWADHFLRWCLVPFNDDKMGGVGSSQRMTPCGEKPTFWEVMADMRLSMRMMEASSTTYIDGGISCLSGRTALYRTEILTDPDLQYAFVNEKWRGKYQLHSGDDKFLTRWLVKKHWNMHFQMHRDAMLDTTFKPNWMFLKQLLRWTRNTWRSDYTSLFVDRVVWRRYPYVAFNMVDKMINPITLLCGPAFIIYAMMRHPFWSPMAILATEICWLFFSRYIRLTDHWRKHPWDIIHLPMYILFSYFFAFMKIYALLTLHVTGWQTRTDASNDNVQIDLSELSVSVTIDNDSVDAKPAVKDAPAADKLGEKPLDMDKPVLQIRSDLTRMPAAVAA
ncbi:Glycosyltransferase 2-like domain-containing protein [Plasmodiophora brassicae]|uniref:Glycosyltransferase 2-like domain-containing protein n=1 Tax=Plasmodiophora brassicae TaxID=37360 RepID=A0A0G4IRM8_PLABS|nr:hypothetical protein PBRA_006143 [Plasmodiophora brassicae]SPQ96146.1 unnamed protein product [Plasmodiophora brassicae]